MSDIKLYQGDCLEVMKNIPDKSVDLILTSPPYDNLRGYNGNIQQWTFDKFQHITKELYRIIDDGGVVVWIVNDATINGSETGTSFKQALYFKEVGFNLHDTMIWNKETFTAVGALKTRYAPVFEYMFILCKGVLRCFNPIKDKPNKWWGVQKHGTIRQKDGSTKRMKNNHAIEEFGQRHNIWNISPEKHNIYGHPAPFPVQLAKDRITSWSNEGDTVLDCFMGSGSTGVAAKILNRNFIGIELDENYFKIAEERINNAIEGVGEIVNNKTNANNKSNKLF